MTSITMTTSRLQGLFSDVSGRARDSGVFGPVDVRNSVVVCQAKASAAPASFRLFEEQGRLWVSLVMADRWLSGSIETDLVHTGDKVEDLVREELVELGALPPARAAKNEVRCEHFRSEDLLFTFRSPVPVELEAPNAADQSLAYLLAYEAAFRDLGDMNAGEDGDE